MPGNRPNSHWNVNNRIKTIVKRAVPEPVRRFRYTFFEHSKYYPALFFSLGRKLECPICQWRFHRMGPGGFDYPVLKEKQVVGASYHKNEVCPRCMSNSRERLLYLYLLSKGNFFSNPKRLLHIAPEPNLKKLIKASPKIKYVSADLYKPHVMARIDVTKMPFLDESFDVVFCNHVLEHVPDDISAMRELHRILVPGGWTILQVPIALALEHTLEDENAKTDQRRIELFGQRDHVRLYSQDDYVQRLNTSGFDVMIEHFAKSLDIGDVQRYALTPSEVIFVGRK